ncbi:YqjF family protein [Ureibacillus thermosphaericus]|uniref:YqjF family protein n=1 Tax=Ureibacillus thermosphaericus TaxID=51173 RepID=UPI00155860A9|nr:DUF2071 domain-containing protein [Ureibacillus thermosphaericus]
MGEIYNANKDVLPKKIPWLMKQTWTDILFLHYPVKKDVLEAHLPPNLMLDTFEGQGWVTIVSYLTKAIVIRGIPSVPMGRGIPGLNVRTYVKAGNKPGIYFFQLAIRHRVTAKLAKVLFHLPYIYLDMSLLKSEKQFHSESSRIYSLPFKCQYNVHSQASRMKQGTLGEWLLERYCFYTTNPQGKLLRCDIYHEPWIVHDVELMEVEHNILSTALNISSKAINPIPHYSKQLSVHIWPLISI